MPRTDGFPAPFRLNDRLVQPALNRIRGPEGSAGVEPRVMRVLLVLASRPGDVISRNELLDEVWGDAVVGEEILTRAISELRRVFGDSARKPAYIETIRQHGYRLIAPVTPAGDADPAPGPAPPKPAAPSPGPEPAPPGATRYSARSSGRAPGLPRSMVLAAAALVLLGVVFAPRIIREMTGDPAAESSGRTAGPPESGAVPLTSFPGRELHPALSPDGTRVAFVWSGPEGDHPDLWVKQRNSETPLRLTDEPAWVAWPAWSPDGQTLAFVQGADTGNVIRLIPSLGGAVRTIHREQDLIEGLDWSPDAGRLVFSARGPGLSHPVLWFLDLGDFRVEELAVARYGHAGMIQPRFAPDGRTLAWIGIDPGRSNALFTAPVTGETYRRLIGGHAPMQGLAWSAGGRSLVFGWSPDDRFTLWEIPREGGEARWIPTPGEFAWNPTTALETGDLAYEEVRLDLDVWQVRIEGRNPWRLTTGPLLASTRQDNDPDIHPEGHQVVFVSSRSGYAELWVSGADGSDPRQVTDLRAASLSNPRWSPAGDRIAFNAVIGGTSRVMIVHALGGPARRVDTGPEPAGFTAWSSDGRTLLVGADRNDRWQILRVAPDGGAPVPLTSGGGLTASEDPSGGTLYFTRPEGAGLWALALRDGRPAGEPHLLLPDLDPRDERHWRLVHDRREATGVVYVSRVGGAALLAYLDFANETSSFLTDLPGLAPSGLAVSPGGDLILFARSESEAGDIMLLRPATP